MDHSEKKRHPGKYFAAAAAAALAAVVFCAASPFIPSFISAGNAPEEAVTRFFDAVCSRDYEKMTEYLCGNPSLGLEEEPDSELGRIVRDAFLESCSYELTGEAEVDGIGVKQPVTFTSLDIKALTSRLKERAEALVEESTASGRDQDEIYDSSGEYKEDFVMGVLSQAARDLIAEGDCVSAVPLVVSLAYEEGEWRVVADPQLLNALSGGTLY